MEGAAVGLFVLVIFAFVFGGLGLWIYCLVEIVRYPEPVWIEVRTDKTMWIIVVILAGWVGALVYWFAIREKLKTAERAIAERGPMPYGYPPPGYGYPPPPGYAPPPPGYAPPPQGYAPPPPAVAGLEDQPGAPADGT